MATRVGVGWSTHFSRPGLKQLKYRRLRYAYRAPSFFLRGMIAAGAEIELVEFDEDLEGADLVSRPGSLPDVDVLYISTHGMNTPAGFQLALHGEDWRLLNGSFGAAGPAIAIFDACNLVNVRHPNWLNQWRSADLGPALRLILGFSTPATVGEKSSIRGAAFAQELDQLPVVDAWFASIQNSSYTGTDKPVAIALGDNDNDAQQVLDTTRIDSFAGPRTSAVPGVAGRS